ncbi:MAG TPA: gliding motility-associated ABC transporter substrate-binding protein GldG, partial [Sphingobacteriaceae bacterium]
MVNLKTKRAGDFLLLMNGVVLIVLINLLSSKFFFRLDLTEEKRFQIKDQTKEMLSKLEEDVFIEVYLEGELNSDFRRFRNSIRETLEEFRIHSDNRVQFTFTDPATAQSEKAQNEFMAELASKGIQPTRVIDNTDNQRSEKLIFPGAIVSYGSAELGVHLLKGNRASAQVEEINQSIEGVEYELANAIQKLSNDAPAKVGWVTGHDELDGMSAYSFQTAISENYTFETVQLGNEQVRECDALVIAKPIKPFSELEKFHLDQFIMNGGKVLFLIDRLDANMDSVSQQAYLAFPYDVKLDDQLFKYGVRINMDLVQDRASGKYPIVTGQSGTRPQIQLIDWPFFPLINQYGKHPITNNLDAVVLKFASSIDTVKAPGIKKTVLLHSSALSRTLTAPVNVSIQRLFDQTAPQNFSQQNIPLAYLLEGKFTSLYKNRFLPDGAPQQSFIADGRDAKIIVVSDGDLAANVVNPRTRQPQALGFDPFTNTTFASRDLLLNMLAHLTNENGLIQVRSKEIKIRPLDKDKVVAERTKWQLINIGLPLLVIVGFGLVRSF